MVENDDIQNEDLDLAWQKASMLSSLQKQPIIIEKAGFWRRFFAYIIDGFILGIIGRFFSSLVGDAGASYWGAIILWLILGILIPAVYFIWPYSRGGQTLGKRFLGLRVVSIDGSPLTWRKGITRTAGYIPSTFVFYLGFLWAIWDSDKQAWQDKVAGTLVLRDSFSGEQLQDYIDPAEASRRQRKWELGLGIPTILIIAAAAFAFTLFLLSGLSEVRDMGEWPGAETLPGEAVDVDLSHLGLELSQEINARDEETWQEGRYDEGILVAFESGGKEVVYIWALRYGDKSVADGDFEIAMALAEQSCGLYTTRNLGSSGIINCSWTDAYNKVLLNQQWILDVLAFDRVGASAENSVDQIIVAISAHWANSP